MVGASRKSRSLAKVAGFQEERLPAHAGKTSKRKLKRTVFEHESFRNCRIYRRSRDGWREENPRGRTTRFIGEMAAPPLSGQPEGGGGLEVGITYHRRAHSFHTMENFVSNFPRHGNFLRNFSTVWKTFCDFFHAMEKFSASFPRYGKLFSTSWKTG